MSANEERCLVLYFHRDGEDMLYTAYRIPLGRSFVRRFLNNREVVRERAVDAIQYSSGGERQVRLWVLAVGEWWNMEKYGAVNIRFLEDSRVRVIAPSEMIGEQTLGHLRRDGGCFTLCL